MVSIAHYPAISQVPGIVIAQQLAKNTEWVNGWMIPQNGKTQKVLTAIKMEGRITYQYISFKHLVSSGLETEHNLYSKLISSDFPTETESIFFRQSFIEWDYFVYCRSFNILGLAPDFQ